MVSLQRKFKLVNNGFEKVSAVFPPEEGVTTNPPSWIFIILSHSTAPFSLPIDSSLRNFSISLFTYVADGHVVSKYSFGTTLLIKVKGKDFELWDSQE